MTIAAVENDGHLDRRVGSLTFWKETAKTDFWGIPKSYGLRPLKVIRSYYGTRWNFYVRGLDVRMESLPFTSEEDPTLFDQLQVEFQSLLWWSSFTLMGENVAECYFRAEDISSDLLFLVCIRAQLPGDYSAHNWTDIIDSYSGYNQHKQNTSLPSWAQLQSKVEIENEHLVLLNARKICKRYKYDDC